MAGFARISVIPEPVGGLPRAGPGPMWSFGTWTLSTPTGSGRACPYGTSTMSAGRMAAAVRKAWRRICQRQTPARMAARPGKIARLVPLEGPEAAGGLVGDQVPEVEPVK